MKNTKEEPVVLSFFIGNVVEQLQKWDTGNVVEQLQNFNSIKYSIEDLKEKTLEKIQSEQTKLEYELNKAIFDIYDLTIAEQNVIGDVCVGIEFHVTGKAVPVDSYPQQNQGLLNDINKNRQTQKGLEGYLQAFLDIWNQELEPDGEFSWQIIRTPNLELENPMLAVIFSTQNYGEKPQLVSQSEQIKILERLGKQENGLLISYNNHQIYLNSLIRLVSDTEIIIIKPDQQNIWTRSMGRTDAGASMLLLLHLQEHLKDTNYLDSVE